MLAQVLLWLAAGVAIIVVLTARFRIHAFFALLAASIVVGLGLGMPFEQLLNLMKTGFGNIVSSLALIIVLGTTLGVLLENTGCTAVMAGYILDKVGNRRSALAMTISGFIAGLPIFCDSGFIVLSGLNKSVAARTAVPMVVMSVSLAAGLYSVHCLLPPHPGASAAAGLLRVDFGLLLLCGLIVALPASAAGFLWARFAGRKYATFSDELDAVHQPITSRIPAFRAFLPVILPLLLIALRSIVADGSRGSFLNKYVLIAGEPSVALLTGILLAISCKRHWKRDEFGKLLEDSVSKAGGILVIIGAGGAFGAILAATDPGKLLGEQLSLDQMGLFFPFLLTFLLKTAQGSSTVAIITAASIIQPLLSSLGLDSDTGRLIAVLAMGAGSMMISHANDAFFWVIAKFSNLEMRPMLGVYSVASVWMGVVSILMVYIINLIIR